MVGIPQINMKTHSLRQSQANMRPDEDFFKVKNIRHENTEYNSLTER